MAVVIYTRRAIITNCFKLKEPNWLPTGLKRWKGMPKGYSRPQRFFFRLPALRSRDLITKGFPKETTIGVKIVLIIKTKRRKLTKVKKYAKMT